MGVYLELASNMKSAFLYRWTHAPSGMWYIGCRTAKNCSPNDGYICSSKHVKPLIEESPNSWDREILMFGESKYVREMEAKYLQSLNAKNDNMSYNRHNGDMKFHTIGAKLTEEDIRKKSEKAKGRVVSEETKEKIRKKRIGSNNPFYGKKHTPEHMEKLRTILLHDNPSKRPEVKAKIAAKSKERGTDHLRTDEARAKHKEGMQRAWTTTPKENRNLMFGDKNPSRRDDVRDKISASLKGHAPTRTGPHSEESKAKMSASKKAYWAKKKSENNYV